LRHNMIVGGANFQRRSQPSIRRVFASLIEHNLRSGGKFARMTEK
jgi:hypothetical protein